MLAHQTCFLHASFANLITFALSSGDLVFLCMFLKPIIIAFHALQNLSRHGAVFEIKGTPCSGLLQTLHEFLIHVFSLSVSPGILAQMALFIGGMPCSCQRGAKALISKCGSNDSELVVLPQVR
jgi:hypothetical protein